MEARKTVLKRFRIAESNSTVVREFLAGITTFLSIVYIFVVQPSILSHPDLSLSQVLAATILVSGLATIAMGLWANVPFVLAPGMEMNSFFAFVLVGGMGFSPHQALGIVVGCGVVFVLVTLTGQRLVLLRSVPYELKLSLGLAMGGFLAGVGLLLAGATEIGLGTFAKSLAARASPDSFYIVTVGCISIFVLDRVLRFKAAVIVCVIGIATWTHLLGEGTGDPVRIRTVELSLRDVGAHDVSVWFSPRAWAAVLTLFVVDFYGSVAKVVALRRPLAVLDELRQSGFNDRSNETIGSETPILRRMLQVDGFATLAAGALGTSNVTIFVESQAGIDFGGRTGLTAVTCGGLCLTVWFFADWLVYVPTSAAACVLIYVGYQIVETSASELRRRLEPGKQFALVIGACMFGAAFLSASLEWSILIGATAYATRSIYTRSVSGPNWFLLTSAVAMTAAIALERFLRQQ